MSTSRHPDHRSIRVRSRGARRTMSLRAAVAALTLALCVALGSGAAWASSPGRSTAAHAAALPQALGIVPPPADDPFYAVPAGIGGLPNGSILASRPVPALTLGAPIVVNAWQVKYKTIDQHGNPSAFVTTVLVPKTPWSGPGPRPLISYQAAIDALSTECAPSYVLRAGATADLNGLSSNAETEVPNILQALLRGFAVTVPDWEGPGAEWISSAGAARGVLDGIRATLSFAPAGIAGSAPIGLVGYSGGALATDWAIQIQSAYAPELHFVGTALGGTPASLQASIADFAANPVAKGAVPLLLAALERSYPDWNLGQDLSPFGQSAVANSQNDCLAGSLVRNVGADPTRYEAHPGAIFDNAHLDSELGAISPLGYHGVPRTPILFYHSSIDELAPVGEMRQLAAKYCAEGLPVQVITSPAGEHIASVITDFPIALSYLADRLAGQPAPNGCSGSPPAGG